MKATPSAAAPIAMPAPVERLLCVFEAGGDVICDGVANGLINRVADEVAGVMEGDESDCKPTIVGIADAVVDGVEEEVINWVDWVADEISDEVIDGIVDEVEDGSEFRPYVVGSGERVVESKVIIWPLAPFPAVLFGRRFQ